MLAGQEVLIGFDQQAQRVGTRSPQQLPFARRRSTLEDQRLDVFEAQRDGFLAMEDVIEPLLDAGQRQGLPAYFVGLRVELASHLGVLR